MTYKERKADSRYLNINTNGNLKLKNNENTRFIIWNLPAVETCPYSTELCRKSCYARKAERVYPDVIFSRKTNLKRSKQSDFVENMIYTIETELSTKKFKNKKVVFRIHESGDFYNLEYTQKWIDICRHFENNENIVFLAYTKSLPFLIGCGYGKEGFPGNLVVRSSLWKDTNYDLLHTTFLYDFPIYTAVPAETMETMKNNGYTFKKCDCIDCGACRKCWNKEYKNIIVAIH